MNQSEHGSNGSIIKVLQQGGAGQRLEVKTSPNKIGSSAIAIGVACVPILLIVFIVIGYKVYSKWCSKAKTRHLYSKRASVVTSMSSISSDEYESISPTSPDEQVVHIHQS